MSTLHAKNINHMKYEFLKIIEIEKRKMIIKRSKKSTKKKLNNNKYEELRNNNYVYTKENV